MPSNPLRDVLLGDYESVGRLAALTVIGVFLTFYSQILGGFGGLDDVFEPGVWSAYLSFAPLFVVGLVVVVTYIAYDGGGVLTGWVVAAIPWVGGFLHREPLGRAITPYLLDFSFGGPPQQGLVRFLSAVTVATVSGFVYALPFVLVGYVCGRGLAALGVGVIWTGQVE